MAEKTNAMKDIINEIYDIYINKTAWYTIIGPILIGAASAGAGEEDKEKLIEMGINLGIAFQIKDDLLGLYSDVNKIGKTQGYYYVYKKENDKYLVKQKNMLI